MDLTLEGKFALISGGTRGIGLATALALADEGCNVAVFGRTKDDVTAAQVQLSNIGVEAIGLEADALSVDDINIVIERVVNAWGTLHILINNVGGGGRWGSDIQNTPMHIWEDVYRKNVGVAIQLTRAFLPYMAIQRWGRIINVASIYGREGGGRPWFNMAKAAEISMMNCLAKYLQYVRRGITFNSVAPGPIMLPKTGWEEMMTGSPEQFQSEIESRPMGRLGKPEEVADMITFLCSERASFINGACIAIDGGESRSF